ncbi:hypothetical protein KM043_001979 [Ampulex compressa]|nr:hypothetical protein KM043_001979 [Ampulex compressa]
MPRESESTETHYTEINELPAEPAPLLEISPFRQTILPRPLNILSDDVCPEFHTPLLLGMRGGFLRGKLPSRKMALAEITGAPLAEPATAQAPNLERR